MEHLVAPFQPLVQLKNLVKNIKQLVEMSSQIQEKGEQVLGK